MKFKVYKYTRHNKWFDETNKCQKLDKYKELPASTLQEYLSDYFNQDEPYMLMFNNGPKTIGIRGY